MDTGDRRPAGGAERQLVEVAVYRLPPDRWIAETQHRVKRKRESLLQDRAAHGLEVTERDEARADSIARIIERVGGWDYNEVVAWVRLIWDGPGPVVKGYLWQVGTDVASQEPRKVYRRGFKPHPFIGGYPLRKVVESWIDPKANSDDIFREIRAQLTAIVAADGPLPGRHLDLRMFDDLGPLVNWRTAVGLST